MANAAHAEVLRRLVEAKGLERFAFVDVVGEGRRMPNGLEVQSGCVVDGAGVVHSFWTGWDGPTGQPTLARWTRIVPESD